MFKFRENQNKNILEVFLHLSHCKEETNEKEWWKSLCPKALL